MAREPRRLSGLNEAGVGPADFPNAAAFDAYVGPARELTVDAQRGILALHDNTTPGGIQFTIEDEGGGGGVASVEPSLRHRVIDFHFGCARGIGFIDGVDAGIIPYTLSAPAAVGATSFAYSGTAPGTSQLLVLLGTDGEYYTVVVSSASAGTCTLREPMPCAVSAGQNAWNFWDNNAHPNARGYDAIADHALRQGLAVWKKVYQRPPRVQPPATLAASTANAVLNPGSANSKYGWSLTPTGAGGGAYWRFVPKRTGVHKLSFQCSKSTVGSADITLQVLSGTTVIKTYTINTASPGLHEVEFYAPGPVDIRMTRSSTEFLVSDLSIFFREEDVIGSLNSGRHMVFGDSWVFDPVGPAARLTTQLPDADIEKSGVGGNQASHLLARFDADVAAAGPFDFVWVVVGTNDIASAITPTVFAENLAALINKIQGIGAIPLIFTPYTGCTDVPTRIDMARRYMASVPYHEQDLKKIVRQSICVYGPASTPTPLISLGVRNTPFRILGSYLSHAADVKEGASHTATSVLVSLAAGYNETVTTVTPDAAGRFVQIVRTVGGAAELINGYVDIEEDW